MKESASFSGKEVENTSLNFTELREKGIEFIQNFSKEVWTDYNSHDPGITILEQLCFALTDIALRTSMPIEDLLTPEKGIPIDPAVNAFFTPSRILSSHAVTTNDQRKMIIQEIKGVDEVVAQETWDYVPNLKKLKPEPILTNPEPRESNINFEALAKFINEQNSEIQQKLMVHFSEHLHKIAPHLPHLLPQFLSIPQNHRFLTLMVQEDLEDWVHWLES